MVRKQGGADRILTLGHKQTEKLTFSIQFGQHGYSSILEPSIDDKLFFSSESISFADPPKGFDSSSERKGAFDEAQLKSISEDKDTFYSCTPWNRAEDCYQSISNWRIYHFHDTSDTAGVKRIRSLHDNQYLRPDASNLAAFLFRLRADYNSDYQQIRKTIQLAIPFFDDFVLNPTYLESGEGQINLQWKQKNSDYPFWPSQLSDGSIRFICLVAALLQPDPPTTIIIDEPELGLHPYAIELLGALIKQASSRMQVIISTQSVQLLNEFLIEDLIIVDRDPNGFSTFSRCDSEKFTAWLDEYTIGELWEKNILGGRPK